MDNERIILKTFTMIEGRCINFSTLAIISSRRVKKIMEKTPLDLLSIRVAPGQDDPTRGGREEWIAWSKT
jgi:hypothetical protein